MSAASVLVERARRQSFGYVEGRSSNWVRHREATSLIVDTWEVSELPLVHRQKTVASMDPSQSFFLVP